MTTKLKATKLKVQPLNTCGKFLNAKTRTASDSEFILQNLTGFIKATKPPIPRGPKRKYQLSATPDLAKMHSKSGERRLEATLHQKYVSHKTFHDSFLKMVAFQTPLYSEQKKEGWGAIDLLAVNRLGYPVVIELKIVNKKGEIESPLRAMMESLAYMIALRSPKNWEDFKGEWVERTEGGKGKALSPPEKMHAIIMAPDNYWHRFKNDRYHVAALPNLQALVGALSKEGFMFHFLSIQASQASDPETGDKWEVGDKHAEVQLWPLSL